MTKVTVLFWEDIPSVVEARDGVNMHKELLSEQFQALIDQVAMKKNMAGTDEYLMQWRKSRPKVVEGSPQEAARAVAEDYESRFKEIRRAELDKLKD